MMRRLLLIRHASAEPKARGGSDRERRLDAQGKAEAAWAGDVLRTANIGPDMILVSPAQRTMETLAGLQPLPGASNIRICDDLYLGEAEILAEQLRAVDDAMQTVAIIAHNPGLQDFAYACLGGVRTGPGAWIAKGHFPTACIAEVAVAGSWSTFVPGGASGTKIVNVWDNASPNAAG